MTCWLGWLNAPRKENSRPGFGGPVQRSASFHSQHQASDSGDIGACYHRLSRGDPKIVGPCEVFKASSARANHLVPTPLSHPVRRPSST